MTRIARTCILWACLPCLSSPCVTHLPLLKVLDFCGVLCGEFPPSIELLFTDSSDCDLPLALKRLKLNMAMVDCLEEFELKRSSVYSMVRRGCVCVRKKQKIEAFRVKPNGMLFAAQRRRRLSNFQVLGSTAWQASIAAF